MVDCSPCRLMWRCPVVIFIHFYICFLINTSVRPGHVLSKPILVALMRIADVGLNSVTWKYCASSGLVVWDRMLFTTFFIVLFPGNFPHSYVFVPGAFNLCFPFFGLSFLVGLVLWCIHHHIETLTILVGMFSSLVKCEFVYLFLGLGAGVSLHVINPLCFHMAAFLPCPLKLLLGPFLVWLDFLHGCLLLSLKV